MISVKFRNVGNSTGVLLPKQLLDFLHFDLGESAVVRIEDEGVLIMKKRTLSTLGKGEKATDFQYSGSVNDGVVLLFDSGDVLVPAEIFRRALRDNAGKTIAGGFSETNPTRGGFGEWLSLASNKSLSPRHASFVAAILCDEAGVSCHHRGNAVLIDFPN